MATQTQTPSPPRLRANGSRVAVSAAAATACLIAAVYVLIGLRVLTVIEPADDQPAFGFAAAGFFLFLAVVLITLRKRMVWVTAMLSQLFIIFTYFNLASQREPSYEVWGLTLRVLQLPLIAALAYLLITNRTARSSPRT